LVIIKTQNNKLLRNCSTLAKKIDNTRLKYYIFGASNDSTLSEGSWI